MFFASLRTLSSVYINEDLSELPPISTFDSDTENTALELHSSPVESSCKITGRRRRATPALYEDPSE